MAKSKRTKTAVSEFDDGTANMVGGTLTVSQFCNLHNITVQTFYNMRRRGQAPRTIKFGARRLIAVEEVMRWRAAMTEGETHAA